REPRAGRKAVAPLWRGIGRRNEAAGNGIFGCRDREPKTGLRDCECLRRPKTPNKAFEYPRRNGLFPVEDGFDGLERLDGGRTRARTWDPMINSLALTVLFQLLSCKLGRLEVERDQCVTHGWLRFFLLIGVAVFAAGAGLLAYRYYTRPVTLTVAGGSDHGGGCKAKLRP